MLRLSLMTALVAPFLLLLALMHSHGAGFRQFKVGSGGALQAKHCQQLLVGRPTHRGALQGQAGVVNVCAKLHRGVR